MEEQRAEKREREKVVADGARATMHSAVTDDHGTPRAVIELCRRVMGKIHTDPCSSAYWNHHTVKAEVFYTVADDGRSKPWTGNCLINPPGTLPRKPGDPPPGQKRSVPRMFWELAIERWRNEEINGFCYIGFSLEQLTYLQGSPMHPLQFPTLFPCERMSFLQRGPKGGPPIDPGSPTHGNFITVVPPKARHEAAVWLTTFRELSQRLDYCAGAVVRPI